MGFASLSLLTKQGNNGFCFTFFSIVVFIEEYAGTAMTKILLEMKPCYLIMYLTKIQGTFVYSFISISIALDYNKQDEIFPLEVYDDRLPPGRFSLPFEHNCSNGYSSTEPYTSLSVFHMHYCVWLRQYLHFITQHKQQGSVGIHIYIYGALTAIPL